MEKIIIILLFIIIFILLFERLQLPKKKRNETAKSNTPKIKKEESSVVGTSKYIPNKAINIPKKKIPKIEGQESLHESKEDESKSSIPVQIPDEDLEDIFSEEINEDEEEELRAMRTPEEDDDLATGVSYNELRQTEKLLTKDNLSKDEQKKATTIAQRLENTQFLDEIEKVLPEARQRISDLLDRKLKSPLTKSKEDFDIGDFL